MLTASSCCCSGGGVSGGEPESFFNEFSRGTRDTVHVTERARAQQFKATFSEG